MPEGDTIHRAAARMRAVLVGRELVRFEAPRLPPPLPAAGATVDRIEARGKHLLVWSSDGLVLHTHLRMTGSWHVYRTGEKWQRPANQAKVTLTCGDRVAVCFNAPVVELLAPGSERNHPSLATLGPDVLDRPLDLEGIRQRARARPPDTPLGELLLDQRVVAGIGNIWRSEALFLEGRSPWAPLSSLTDDELDALVSTAGRIMGESLGPFTGRPRREVYRRAGRPCRRCGTPVESRAQGAQARTAYWCPACQPG